MTNSGQGVVTGSGQNLLLGWDVNSPGCFFFFLLVQKTYKKKSVERRRHYSYHLSWMSFQRGQESESIRVVSSFRSRMSAFNKATFTVPPGALLTQKYNCITMWCFLDAQRRNSDYEGWHRLTTVLGALMLLHKIFIPGRIAVNPSDQMKYILVLSKAL